MNGSYLLDANIIVGVINGDEQIRTAIARAGEIYLPTIAVGELHFGAAKSARPEANRAVIAGFVEEQAVLPCDLAVAEEYGRLKQYLRSKGTPIPENDIWIAATALSNSLTLATRDKHFEAVPNLAIVSW